MKKITGKIEVKGKGIVLTSKSTEEEIARAVKHVPALGKMLGTKPKADAKK